jgi:hypothetical protein
VESQQLAITTEQPIYNNIGIVFSAWSMPIAAHGTLEYISATAKLQLHCNRGTVFSVWSLLRYFKHDS